ncbi:MAG: DUF952 domain-containing protein [Acholeplasma sp.]|nr:DUF952 domain-containing protein [Acholeplasma sp.]
MKILVTMPKKDYKKTKWIGETLMKDGFIHATTVELAYRIIDKFHDGLLSIWIDTELLISPVKFEDKNNNKLFYPHIYGLINQEAIMDCVEMDVNDIIDKKGHFENANYI